MQAHILTQLCLQLTDSSGPENEMSTDPAATAVNRGIVSLAYLSKFHYCERLKRLY